MSSKEEWRKGNASEIEWVRECKFIFGNNFLSHSTVCVCRASLNRHAQSSKSSKSTPIAFLTLSPSLTLTCTHTHPNTPALPPSHTHTRAHPHTRAVLSKAPLLDLSHLAKEVPAEARESQSETKERRTVEGEERIGEKRTGLRKERHSALWRGESEEREEGGVERRKKKRRGNRKRNHFQLQPSVSQHGQCTIPRHVKPSLYACLCSRYFLWFRVPCHLTSWLSSCYTLWRQEAGGGAGLEARREQHRLRRVMLVDGIR